MAIRETRLRDRSLSPDIRATLAPVLRVLSGADGPLLALGLGLLLCLPALLTGFALADHALRLNAHGHAELPLARPAYDLFSWLGPHPEELRAIADLSGVWSLPEGTSLRAPRPLTSLLHALEQRFWPEQAWLMHLQGLLWHGLLLALLLQLYRGILGGGWIAVTALLLYAIDDARGPAVAAITGRHQLVAAVGVVVALLAHHRWRAEGWAPGAWLGPLLFAVALAASETAVGLLAWVLAYVIVLERAPGPQQWATFAGYAGVAVVWFVLVAALGYSVTDPLRFPGLALATLATNAPLLALAQAGIPFAPLLAASGLPAVLAALVASALVAGLAWLLSPLLQRNAVAAFWGLGGVLALIPATLGGGGEAALVLPGIGFAALLAQFFAAVLYTARDGRMHSLRPEVAALAGGALLLHGVVAPLLLPLRAAAPLFATARLNEIDAGLPTDAALADQQLVIVNAPDAASGPGLLARRAVTGGVLPESARVLALGPGTAELERIAADQVVLTLAQGMTPLPLGSDAPVTALAAAEFVADQSVEVEGFGVRIVAAEAGRATRIEFTFDVPCDNESLRWVAWDGTGYRPFVVPEIGASVPVGAG